MQMACCALHFAVIPANAEALFNSASWSIHFRLSPKSNMDSRVRGNDGEASVRIAGNNRIAFKDAH
jgi:hypothetical protein